MLFWKLGVLGTSDTLSQASCRGDEGSHCRFQPRLSFGWGLWKRHLFTIYTLNQDEVGIWPVLFVGCVHTQLPSPDALTAFGSTKQFLAQSFWLTSTLLMLSNYAGYLLCITLLLRNEHSQKPLLHMDSICGFQVSRNRKALNSFAHKVTYWVD